MSVKIALTGNPNCGKTSIFNALTGSAQYVGNWPGVTVEKKEGRWKQHHDVLVADLPGIYSLSPYSPEEVVTREYLLSGEPQVILNVVDATNLERNLYLTTQLLEVGLPVVVALNMMDLLRKRQDKIDRLKLSQELGCPVIETSAVSGKGLDLAVETAVRMAKEQADACFLQLFPKKVEDTLQELSKLAAGLANGDGSRRVAPSAIRWYGVKLFERDQMIMDSLGLDENQRQQVADLTGPCARAFDDDPESVITTCRYDYIEGIAKRVLTRRGGEQETVSDKIDKLMTNRLLALPIFAVLMWLVYFISIQVVGETTSGWLETFFGWLGNTVGGALTNWGAAAWLVSLCVDGIISGVGAVLTFVPQLIVLFLCLAFLEDCGYMARVAFIMDRLLRKFGLSGKSFIPMIISTGCGVPGIMATRTIENESDRRLTIMVTTFIPCGAKLPIIALISGAFFPASAWVAPSVYFLGIFAVVVSGLVLKRTKPFAGKPSPFVLELPSYHLPTGRNLALHVWDRTRAFVVKAGTIIFVACGVIWFLSSFNWQLQMVDSGESMLAAIGKAIAPVFAPLGFGEWQAAVATITGFIAKENVVGTFGVLLGLGDAANDAALYTSFGAMFTAAQAYAFMAFNILCAPCVAAIGAMRREFASWKWTFAAIAWQTGFAYLVALLINQIGGRLG